MEREKCVFRVDNYSRSPVYLLPMRRISGEYFRIAYSSYSPVDSQLIRKHWKTLRGQYRAKIETDQRFFFCVRRVDRTLLVIKYLSREFQRFHFIFIRKLEYELRVFLRSLRIQYLKINESWSSALDDLINLHFLWKNKELLEGRKTCSLIICLHVQFF